MPFIHILVREDTRLPNDRADFSAAVRRVVASALTCKGGELHPDKDIEVKIDYLSEELGDWSPCNLSVSIEAIGYPDRVRNQPDRGDQIRGEIEALLPGTKVGVWLNLPVTATWSESAA